MNEEDGAEGEHGEDEYGESVAAASQIKQSHDTFTEVYNKFVATYKNIPTTSKFVFSISRRTLEDVIFENASVLTMESSVHLWVIDLGDDIVTDWFLPTELDELRSLTLSLPETDKVFAASMARFSLVCFSLTSYRSRNSQLA